MNTQHVCVCLCERGLGLSQLDCEHLSMHTAATEVTSYSYHKHTTHTHMHLWLYSTQHPAFTVRTRSRKMTHGCNFFSLRNQTKSKQNVLQFILSFVIYLKHHSWKNSSMWKENAFEDLFDRVYIKTGWKFVSDNLGMLWSGILHIEYHAVTFKMFIKLNIWYSKL